MGPHPDGELLSFAWEVGGGGHGASEILKFLSSPVLLGLTPSFVSREEMMNVLASAFR